MTSLCRYAAFALLTAALPFSAVLRAQTVRVDITPSHAVNTIDPKTSVGAGVDRIPVDAIDHDLTDKSTIQQTLESGWHPVTYRQNTDLGIEAWHWNSEGTWSESGEKGYFVGSSTSTAFIRHSFGYALPRRGTTRNDGTGNSGYSRLTDGDESTYWKSNPYLTSHFTGEDDSLHPQWVIIDLADNFPIDTLKIAWAEPYATQYLVQFFAGADPIHRPTAGVWQTFPHGIVTDGKGGNVELHLTASPTPVRYLRIWMTHSSNTCDTHANTGHSDPRDCVGYAMKELYLGTTSADGIFHDLLRHTADQEQTATYASSTDPWHESTSQVNSKEAQVGFDLFFQSGITRGLPAMIPIAMLYETPENMAAEVRYLENHHYPISYIEMGEEADGQYMLPEDYAALYLQYATALHHVDPNLKLGGPSFQGVNQDIDAWPDAEGRSSWTVRFLDYLRSHNRLGDLSFFSFEHYPYEPCRISWASLYQEPELVTHITQVWRDDGVPANIPIFITESNLSSSTSETYMDMFGGLWLADYIGSFLSAGGNGVYYFHYLPLRMEHGCNDSIGSFGMFTVNADYEIQQRLSQFYAAQMINREWLDPDGGPQRIFPVASDINDGAGHTVVTGYAAQRSDGEWSLMLVNNDQHAAHTIHISLDNAASNQQLHFSGTLHEAIFGSEQYKWQPATLDFNAHRPEALNTAPAISHDGHANPDGPIATRQITAAADQTFELPAASIVVIRGKQSVP